MLQIRQIKVPVLEDTEETLIQKISRKCKISPKEILSYHILKKSIDARDKNSIFYVYEVLISCSCENQVTRSQDISFYEEVSYEFPKPVSLMKDRPIIVGSGPAGLFCAYMLAEAGLCPIVLERGEKMEDRILSVARFFETNELNPNSNIQFGEGGAGTFSDGKLNTLTKDKMGRGKKVLEIFVQNGAPEEILYIHNPHIGTDILRKVITHMRNHILALGGEFHYQSCVTDLMIQEGKIVGVLVNETQKFLSSHVILAIGHSARDTFRMLHEKNIVMKPKNFAVGLRIEHPREMIDQWQYGKFASIIGSANYKLTYQTKEGRAVYSFCMCPGGFVVNASSYEGGVVVNGMSNYLRDEKNSNSAIVVSVSPSDFGDHLFAGMEFQQKLEEAAYVEGGGFIPVQLYGDFCKNQKSTSFGEYLPNTKGEVSFGNLRSVLPEFISSSIMEAMCDFQKKIHGFAREDAILLGVETRTSSPIVICRGEDFQSTVQGLYPCGEGAGYAGGITTAAIDGIKVAEKIVLSL